jgi:hypothetical protein
MPILGPRSGASNYLDRHCSNAGEKASLPVLIWLSVIAATEPQSLHLNRAPM